MCCNEPVATNMVFSDILGVDVVTPLPIFDSRHSLVADAFGLKIDLEFVNTLEDNIRERGALNMISAIVLKPR
jgi:hypothetical protein